MLEQGTKPSTISLVLMSNPLAMLGWWVAPQQPLSFDVISN